MDGAQQEISQQLKTIKRLELEKIPRNPKREESLAGPNNMDNVKTAAELLLYSGASI